MLSIKNIDVCIGEKKIIEGLSLDIKKGQVHAIMGPNGSGKSSLSFALMGHPNYKITKGQVFLDEINIINKSPDYIENAGLFLSFQKPLSFQGLSIFNFLRNIRKYKNSQTPNKNLKEIKIFIEEVKSLGRELKIKEDLLKRSLNDGFSGGEMKKMELLQLMLIKPKYVILDEIDTGLDIDALKIIAEEIKKIKKETGIVIITHYLRILKYLNPDFVHVLVNGKIVRSGDFKLALEIEKRGYSSYAAG